MAGALYGVDSLISSDMGGTSFDLGYVLKGEASYTLRPEVEGFAVNLPMLEIRAVGAGGGSIASVVGGELRVGPRSAGALPGPVCFDLGGTEPTVTDADLILGILDPGYFLGGTMKLDPTKARRALEQKVAEPLGIPLERAAWAIKSRIDEAMGRELKRVREKMTGADDPLLVVHGGAGPAHCCHMARFADLHRILVTPFSAVFSAFSSSNMDVGHRYDSRLDLPLEESRDLGALEQAVRALERKAMRDMRGEGFSAEQVDLTLELFVKAGEEGPEVRFGSSADFHRSPDKIEEVVRTARELIDRETPSKDKRLTLTMISLVARAEVAHFEMAAVPPASVGEEKARKGSRRLVLDGEGGELETPVYDRTLLTNGHRLVGPALIESEHTTLLVPPGWRVGVDRYNNAILEEVQEE